MPSYTGRITSSTQDLLDFLKLNILGEYKRDIARRNSELKQELKRVKAEDLHIGEQLGSGGFGSVYEVFVNNKKYALKKLHKNAKNERAARESYNAEASVLHIRHPNIVESFQTLTVDDSPCILMEFVSRRTLQTIIDDSNEILNQERRVRFALDIAKALEFSHKKGIAHLDLKPANVLVTSTDVCKLADFGCCQPVGSIDSDRPASPTKSNLTGTYAYRAPELLKGDPPCARADIYSLGICLWQMLVREKPYGTQNHHVVIFGVVAYNLRPKIPPGLTCETTYTELMTRCWDKNAKRRPTGHEVSTLLSGYLNQLTQSES